MSSRVYDTIKRVRTKSEPRKMDYSDPQVHRRSESLGSVALSLGDVLASARSRYGNPWLSILRQPRSTYGFFIYLTPIDIGLTYSLHAFTINGDRDGGVYIGKSAVVDGKSTRRGVTEEYWHAFTQDYAPTTGNVFFGVLSAVEGYIR